VTEKQRRMTAKERAVFGYVILEWILSGSLRGTQSFFRALVRYGCYATSENARTTPNDGRL